MSSGILKPVLGSQIQLGHPLAGGLVGCWLLNEGAGDKVADVSGYGNKGTLDSTLEWQAGRFGRAVEFDPGTVEVITTDRPAATNPYITYVAWIYPRGASDGGYGGIYWDQVAGSASRIMIKDDGAILAQFTTTGTTYSDTTPAGLVSINQWSQVVFTWDGTTGRYYVNGVFVDSQVEGSGTIFVATLALIIGVGSSTDSFRYDGLIDHIYLYDRALPDQEIAQLYREPFCMFEQEPIELWTAAVVGSVKVYSRGDAAALPADDTDLENAFTNGEYTQVETDDADRVPQTATDEFAAFLFKDKYTGQDAIDVKWNGQSDLAPSDSTIYLQIYNRISPGWETLDSDNLTAANTDFDLEGQVVADLGEYFDANFWIACRVYQEAI